MYIPRKCSSPECGFASTLILGFPGSSTVRRKCLLFVSHLVCGFVFFIAAQWTKTVYTSNRKLGGATGYFSVGKIVKVIMASLLFALG